MFEGSLRVEVYKWEDGYTRMDMKPYIVTSPFRAVLLKLWRAAAIRTDDSKALQAAHDANISISIHARTPSCS